MLKIWADKAIILFLLVFWLGVGACTQQICPAYQSYYIHDHAKRDAIFSLFNEDTLPKKVIDVNKNRYGIIDRDPYLVKSRSLHTVAMKDVFAEPGSEQDTNVLYAQLQMDDDTTVSIIDQYGAIPRPEIGYNMEQEYYSYEFGYIFEDESRYMINGDAKDKDESGSDSTIFQRLFDWIPFLNPGNKHVSDSAQIQKEPQEVAPEDESGNDEQQPPEDEN